jgi:hypothetical protein
VSYGEENKMKYHERIVKALKDSMEKPNKPEMDLGMEDGASKSKPYIPKSLTEYVERVRKFRRKLEKDGCPLCGSAVETRKTKFHLIEWDFWICTSESSCDMSEAFNDVWDTEERFNSQEDQENVS